MNDSQNIWAVIAILIFAVVAIVFVLKKLRLRRAHSWPVAPGKVESTGVRLETSGVPPNMSSAYVASLHYSYSALGAFYSGEHRRRFMLQKSASKFVEQYKEGLPVTVRYNPANPKDSELFDKEQAVVEGA